MEHYLVCPYVINTILPKMRLKRRAPNIRRLMLLEPEEHDDTIKLACVVYSVRRCVHTFRAQNTRADADQICNHLWEAIKVAASHHKNIGGIVKGLWSIARIHDAQVSK